MEEARWARGAATVAAVVALLAAACAEAAPEEVELGRVELQATGSPEARPWFERGVAALHSFWYEEAGESFRRAREIDPDFVMAYWGEAMSHNHPVWDRVHLGKGREALAALAPTAAERAAKAPTERERAYLEAVELLYPAEGEEGEKAERDRAYEEAMGRLAERFPDDPEARIFHALAIEGVVYGGVEETLRFPLLMRAAASLEDLFDRYPEHPGVLHYLIHAYDDPVHAPLGLRPARLYARVAPAAHHALHMPSHIFVQLGRWDEAAASNEDAWEASVAWVEREELPIGRRDYHSLQWLLYAYLQQGRLEAALGVLETLRRDAESDPVPMDLVERVVPAAEARFRIETLRPERPGPVGRLSYEGEGPPLAALHAEALAAGFAADAAVARRAVEAYREEVGEAPAGGSTPVTLLEMEASLALAEGRHEEALALLAEAAEAEAAFGPPSGPPETLKPAHELYGDVLLVLDRPREAAEHYASSLRRTPRRALSLLGAARAAAALGDRETAEARYRELLDVWEHADPDLPSLAEARGYLAGGPASGDRGGAASSARSTAGAGAGDGG